MPQGKTKKVVASFPSEVVKLSEMRSKSKRRSSRPQNRANEPENKLVQSQKRKKWIEFVQNVLIEVVVSNSGAQ